MTASLRRVVRGLLHRSGLRRAPRPETFEVAFAAIVGDDVHNEAAKLKLDILNRYGRNPGIEATPHVTLKLGFPVPIDAIGAFEEYFDRLLEDVAPFPVRVKGVGFFDEGIVFLDVEPSPPLDRLRRRIVADLSARHGIPPHRLEGDAYHFHVTAGYVEPRDLPDARRAFQGKVGESTFTLETLAMLCHTGSEWVTYKRGRLRGPAAGEAP